ncbi:MAG: GAF domain-containing protein, partial [Thermomicrobiaceae bacterium]|nr:GAF domain-containing protein [Thermomicrobiaceae bacterium]
SWVAEQVRAGKLPPEAAATHPRRNVITRCLGVKESVQVDLVEETLAAGDLLLLCSDGLYRDVEEARLAVILERYGAEAATVLVDEAKRLGGHDNVTVVTVAVDPPLDRDSSLLDRIALLNRLGRELTMSLNLDATLRSVVEQLLVLTGGERAAILLREPDGRLAPRVAHSVGAMGSLAGHSHSVAEQALRERKPVIVANALDDPRFATAESIIDLALRSIACVPMIVKEDAVGVLYVDSSAESGVFEQTELDLLVSFASQAAAAIQNARLHEALVARTRELELLRAQQDALIRSLSSALVAVDTAGRVTHWNPAAEEILGVPAASAIGAPLADLLPAPAATWLTNLMVETETDSQTMLMAHEWEGAVGRRGRVVLAARVARIQGPEGGVTGFAFILNDRTDIVLMDEARRAESAERERLRDLFGRYLAPPLVERLLNSPESVRLGGARHDITVLFADVRGFTGLSERLPPEEVVALLNQYLALATTEIFKEFGTLDKFMGDGVLAIFGAPLPVAEPERAAVRAALAMRARLDRLREETGVRVGFGIGLNSGEAIV